jgi:acetyl esterase/lipase
MTSIEPSQNLKVEHRVREFLKALNSAGGKPIEIYASPLQATTEQLTGLPPALIQAAGNDVLRDEASSMLSA